MDVTLGLLPDSPAGDDGGGVPSGGSTTVKSILTKEDNNKNNMVMCSEVSSAYPVGDQHLGDLELGLGLSIGGGLKGKVVAGGGWSQYARILTAKDFKQNSCSSSCSVSIPNSVTSGYKRSATDSVSPTNGNRYTSTSLFYFYIIIFLFSIRKKP
ncbi:putative AUX/IAA protein [Helianthus annuus]|nr:putative AUX/IAA protein [Helianthus annuus]